MKAARVVCAWGIAIGALLGTGVAIATVREGVLVFLNDPDAVVSGAGGVQGIRLQSGVAGDLRGLEVIVNGIRCKVVGLDERPLVAGGTREVRFAMPAGTVAREVLVRGQVGAVNFEREFRLSEGDADLELWRASSTSRELAAAARAAAGRNEARPEINLLSVRVHGTIGVVRSDGVAVPIDSAQIAVYESGALVLTHQIGSGGVTTRGGVFDLTVPWSGCVGCAQNPALAIVVSSTSPAVDVKEGVGGQIVSFTSPWRVPGGADLDLGTVLVVGSGAPAMYALTNLVRARRWAGLYSSLLPQVTCVMRSDNTYYTDATRTISIGPADDWSDWAVAHEYGHHWQEISAPNGNVDTYLNSVCDGGSPQGGHCAWCAETARVGWVEGFADFFATRFGVFLPVAYGGTQLLERDRTAGLETNKACSTAGGASGPPEAVEGHVAALLFDIADAAADDENPAAQGADVTNYGDAAVFQTTVLSNPDVIETFYNSLEVLHPSDRNALWRTAMNNGFDFDRDPPTAPTGVVAQHHSIGVGSNDVYLSMTWTAPTDDGSGVRGYSVQVGLASPPTVDQTMDIGSIPGWRSPKLNPGVYYFGVRAVDYSDHWGPTATVGPFFVNAPGGADLIPYAWAGWDGPMVPRAANDATETSAVFPTLPLPIKPAVIYSAFGWANVGTAPTGNHVVSVIHNSDLITPSMGSFSAGTLQPNEGFYYLGFVDGPWLGQRATRGTYPDWNGTIAESDETNNAWAQQFNFQPEDLSSGALLRNPRPPLATAGWEAITNGTPRFVNCAAYKFTPTTTWSAVTLASKLGGDYDLRLHEPIVDVFNGLDAVVKQSARVGDLDAILIDRDQPGNNHEWNVSVVRTNSTALLDSQFVQYVPAVPLAVGATGYYTMRANESMKLVEFTGGPVGGYEVQVILNRLPPGDGIVPLRLVSLFGSIETIASQTRVQDTDESGTAVLKTLLLAGGSPGTYAVYRDPFAGTGAVDFSLYAGPTGPDFTVVSPPGWAAPLVPRAAADGTDGSVPLPAFLSGDQLQTYLNIAVRNAGPNPAQQNSASEAGPRQTLATVFTTKVQLDGALLTSVSTDPLAGGASQLFHLPTPFTVSGGRHVLAMQLDTAGAVGELNALNNRYGRSWVWTPSTLASGATVTRPAPPAPYGGWGQITEGAFGLPNCDGLRLPSPSIVGQNGRWQGMAIMPGASGALHLDLFEASSGAGAGFDTSRIASEWGVNESAYVLANFNKTASRPFDVGIRQVSGSGNVTAEAVASTYLATNPSGNYGPFTIGSGRILALHEMQLPAGPVLVALNNVTGTVDWGFTIHPADSAYHAKGVAASQTTAWLNGAGLGEAAAVTVPVAGRYLVAVWKSRNTDLAASGSYSLSFSPGVLSNDDGHVPRTSAIQFAAPSPMSDVATIEFDVARAGPVSLRVFDVRGALVRTLEQGALPAGRHRRQWDGTDANRRRCPSGVYFAKLVAADGGSVRRIVKME